MEYNLLKTIEPNQNVLVPKETMPRLTPYPANNCVNPGLGQIARVYSFYVPLYTRPSIHSISKNEPNVEAMFQEGKGEESQSDEEIPTTSALSQNDDKDINPIDFNERKRKLMGIGVHESFLHPKFIKTDKIVFSKELRKTESKPKVTQVTKPKEIKHKFQFE
jgi:hypothetical protein